MASLCVEVLFSFHSSLNIKNLLLLLCCVLVNANTTIIITVAACREYFCRPILQASGDWNSVITWPMSPATWR